MSKPYIHAQSSARKWGGKPEDYLEIHNLMDSSKAAIASNLHRALTHQSWFVGTILERIKFSNSAPPTGDNHFTTIINSDGKHVSVRDIGEDHVLEDFGMKFIPSAADYLNEITFQDWMQNGHGSPPSFAKINEHRKRHKGVHRSVVNDGTGKLEPVTTIVPPSGDYVIDGGKRSEWIIPDISEILGKPLPESTD